MADSGRGCDPPERELAVEKASSIGQGIAAIDALPARAPGRLAYYIELTKPRILVMILLTVIMAMVAAGGAVSVTTVVWTCIGTCMVAASASVFNQWLERDRDGQMRRTADRPLPAGRLSDRDVLNFGLATGVVGLAWLAMFAGAATAAFGLAAWLTYVAIYTPLKRLTTFNTFVGAIAGALPAAIGWSAAEGSFSLTACGLFGLVFLWQFPHFMAIAWMYRHEYQAAGFKMLSVVDPTGRRAGRCAVGYAAALTLIGPWLALTSGAGLGVAAWSLVAGAGQLACAWRFARRLDDASARQLLRASLAYLPAVLAGLLLASGGPAAWSPT